jgi:hypothetical protein
MKGIAVLTLALAANLIAADTAPPASAIMETARAAAASQHKAIFLIFHASW